MAVALLLFGVMAVLLNRIAALVVGFPYLILIPFFYSALLTRLRRIQALAQ